MVASWSCPGDGRLGLGCTMQQLFPWVLRKGGTDFCLPKNAMLGGMGGEDLGSASPFLLAWGCRFLAVSFAARLHAVLSPASRSSCIRVKAGPQHLPLKAGPASPAHQDEPAVGLGRVLAPCIPMTCSHQSTQSFPGGEEEREDLHFISLSEGDPRVGYYPSRSLQLAAGTAQRGIQAEIYKSASGTAALGSLGSIHLPGPCDCISCHGHQPL